MTQIIRKVTGMPRYWLVVSAAFATGLLCPVQAATGPGGIPRIAVPDLTYETQVSEYFNYEEADASLGVKTTKESKKSADSDAENLKNILDDSDTDDDTDSKKRKKKSTSSAELDFHYIKASGEITHIERGELHAFAGDIQGALVRSGLYQVSEARPWVDKDTIKIYDVITRIKHGDYPGADYVLFGTLTNVDIGNDELPIQGTNAINNTVEMNIDADFSLISTKNYQIVAGFSAHGSGSDARLTNDPGFSGMFDVSKVMQETSRSLGAEVAAQVEQQFSGRPAPDTNTAGLGHSSVTEDAPVVYH